MEDITLNEEDLDFDAQEQEDLQHQDRIDTLSKEIAALRARMNVPPAIQKAIGGMGLGHGLGVGGLGTLAMGLIGFQLGKNQKELDEKERQKIAGIIQGKAQELLALQRGEEAEQAKQSGIMSAGELVNYQYDSYPFDGKWQKLVGHPAKSFHMMVFGRPKQGKSIFCFQLAKYLTKFGKVLYIASEEGFSATLQQKLTEFGAVNENLHFANFRDFDQIRSNLIGTDYKFIVVDSINFINLEPEDVELLKSENPGAAFITIQQATKNGAFRGSQQFAHNCDIIIEVVEGVANHTGRYGPPSEMNIFEKPNFKGANKKTSKAPVLDTSSQLQIFDENERDQ